MHVSVDQLLSVVSSYVHAVAATWAVRTGLVTPIPGASSSSQLCAGSRSHPQTTVRTWDFISPLSSKQPGALGFVS